MGALSELAERIIDGYRITEMAECKPLLTGDLEELMEGADRIRKAL